MIKVKNICCIGAGYVGGPTMAVIALKCPHLKITVVDLNQKKIDSWNGPVKKLPVFEPGLETIIKKVRNKNLFFSTDIDSAIHNSEMIFIAVNTPTKTKGKGKGMAADLKYFISSAKKIAKVSRSNKIIVEKSTLPVRTAEKVKEVLLKNRKESVHFEILSNPEFLAEGTAINDLFKSDRVLIGGDSTKSGQDAVNSLVKIYKKWVPEEKILTTNVWSSELSKLASNAMLAQRISSINSLSALCEKTGADIDEVATAIGMDTRIGKHFLKSSPGFGGSCFKKDILNLVYIARTLKLNEVADYWENVIKINDYQRNRFSKKIIDFKRKNNIITILGWAFKKNTNDSRESASIYVAKNLLEENLELRIYDPKVRKERILFDLNELYMSLNYSKSHISNALKKVKIFDNHIDALKKSSVAVVITEWDNFKNIEWEKLINENNCPDVIFDGRNFLFDTVKKIKNIKYFKL